MKKITGHRFLLMLFLSTITIGLLTNCSSSKSANGSMSNQDSQWFQSKEWLNGLKLAPHESINQQEFSRQYHINKKWWDEA